MKFLSTVPQAEVEALKSMLIEAGHEATITHGYEHTFLNTTEAGEKWIRAKIAAGVTPTVAAPAEKKNRANPKVQDDAPSIQNDFKKLWLPVIVGAALFLFAISMFFGQGDQKGYANNAQYTAGQISGNESIEELRARREKEYGRDSEWSINFTYHVHKQLLRNPRTAMMEDYRMFTFERDSLTVVYAFSGENDFGVRKDHSITVVVDPHTGDIARTVSMQ